MPCYQATVLRSDPAIPTCIFQFIAASDLQAVTRMPAVSGDCLLEIWRGKRLVAIIDADTAIIAEQDIASVAAALIEGVMTGH